MMLLRSVRCVLLSRLISLAACLSWGCTTNHLVGGGGRGATFGRGGGVERLFRGFQMACKATCCQGGGGTVVQRVPPPLCGGLWRTPWGCGLAWCGLVCTAFVVPCACASWSCGMQRHVCLKRDCSVLLATASQHELRKWIATFCDLTAPAKLALLASWLVDCLP